MLATKKNIQEIIEQISVFGRKNAAELTIHRWKLKAKALENEYFAESKRLQGIINVYENNYDLAFNNFEQAINVNKQSSALFNDYGQALLMSGRGLEAIKFLLQAFKLEPSYYHLNKLLSLSTSLLFKDVFNDIHEILEKYNISNQEFEDLISTRYQIIEDTIDFLSEISVSLGSYRRIVCLNDEVLFKYFYTHSIFCSHKHDNSINLIVYPQSLDSKEISFLNDEFVNKLIEMDIPSEELMKVALYYSADHQH